MNHHTMSDDSVNKLQSNDRKVLMDVIDRLRSKGINQHVHLPEIVVCGDQSSGKSSVLQAISGMSFPAKDSVCTRFATELVLRRTEPEVTESFEVKIISSNDQSPSQRQALEDFNVSQPPGSNDIGPIVERAKEVMGLGDHGSKFGTDRLRIEISGPNQPHLTIVDLPGLFHAGNKDQTDDDAKTVSALVRSYMENPRSIILAVVSASNNFVNQVATKLARDIDPRGHRTMGLITKPDMLDVGSQSERDFFKLAQNEDVPFRLGWHVVRNRDFASRDTTNAERDDAEAEFFSSGIWTDLDSCQKGANALKVRLSEELTNQILKQLPEVLQDVEQGIDDCSRKLDALGSSRGTRKEQRKYLLEASVRFSSLLKSATDGVYNDRYFGSASEEEGYKKRLRAVIQNLLIEFGEHMRVYGRSRIIVDDEETPTDTENQQSQTVSRKQYLEEVNQMMRRNRGRELVGTYNPMIIGDLFKEQSRPWRACMEEYSQKIIDAVESMVYHTLQHVVDKGTLNGLWTEILSDKLSTLKEGLSAKSSEILILIENAHPITYSQAFMDKMGASERQRFQEALEHEHAPNPYGTPVHFSIAEIMKVYDATTGKHSETRACDVATDTMEEYYQVSLDQTIDDFSRLAVEACVMAKLADLLTPSFIFELEDDQVKRIAEEKNSTARERTILEEKHAILTSGLGELRRLNRNRGFWDAEKESADETIEERDIQSESSDVEDSPRTSSHHAQSATPTSPTHEAQDEVEYASEPEAVTTQLGPEEQAREAEIEELLQRKQRHGKLTKLRQRRLEGLLEERNRPKEVVDDSKPIF